MGAVQRKRTNEGCPTAAACASMTAASWHRTTSCATASWLSLLAGAFALLGCPGHHYTSRAYFANATREPVKVRVQELVADVDCSRVKGRSAELLAQRELFGNPATYEVLAGEALPLQVRDDDLSTSQRQGCAVLVQVLGFPDQLVFWPDDAMSAQTESTRAEGHDARFRAQSLTLEGHGEVKGLAAGEGLEVTPLPPVASGTATASDAPALLGWSGTPRTGTDFVLLRHDALPDGCASLELGKPLETSWPLYLCAPAWSLPFEVGDELHVTAQDLTPASSAFGSEARARATQLTIARPQDGARLEIWLNAGNPQVAAVETVTGLGSDGRHTACSAYVEPASVQLMALKPALKPGDEREAIVLGRRSRAFLGRADDVLIAPDACPNEHSSLGVRFDLLMLSTPAEESP